MTISVGTVLKAIDALRGISLPELEKAVASGFSDKNADMEIEQDALAVLAAFFPQFSLLLALAALALAVANRGTVRVAPGTSGEGQTHRTFNPGDPAARL